MTDDEFLNDRDCTPKGETPRTDAASRTVWDHALVPEWPSRGGSQDVVHVDFARELERGCARLQKENDHLRASLANSGGPCAYCKLPKEKWAECAIGFPGCARGDDAMLCPHVGADIDAREELARALRVVEAAKELAANCEEYEFDDGLGYAAQGMWWYDLDNALEEWEAGR